MTSSARPTSARPASVQRHGRVLRCVISAAERGAHLDAEAEQIAASASGDEGREGVRAFTERRPPRFHDKPAIPAAADSRE